MFSIINVLLLQTVDQFFALKVPMRSAELSSLFRGIDNAFQVYASHVVDKLGEQNFGQSIFYSYLKDSTFF